MGHPKKSRRKYETPKKMFSTDRIEKDKKLVRDFGLRRKREIWKAESMLRIFRRRAREIQAHHDEKKEKDLINKMIKIGLIKENETIEKILDLKVEDILKRRLQSVVFNKGFSKTIRQARQGIVHKHVSIEGIKFNKPGFLVPTELESSIKFSGDIPEQEEIKKDIKSHKAKMKAYKNKDVPKND